MSKPYNLVLPHSHRYVELSRVNAVTIYEHCVDCGHLRQAPYQAERDDDYVSDVTSDVSKQQA